MEKTTEGVEGFGFATHLSIDTFESLCMNEMSLLKLFVKRFREEFNPTLFKMKEECVDIASLIGPLFYQKNTNVPLPSVDKKLFLKQFQLTELLELSEREKEVLFYISKGLFAIQIAELLHLSKRTVEHYTENIKNKLNCYSKAELIQKANTFLSLGYSLP